MFLDGLVQRKIAALLRPWLAEEPQWEVKLGFLGSIVVARGLRFECSALNELIGRGVRLCFKDVKVEELSVHVAHWSAPAINVEVRGVHVTLSAAETVSDPMAKSSDTSLTEKRKVLRRIDPEGSALHDNLEKIMNYYSSESWMRYSLVNLILTKCCLHVHGIHLRLEFPFADEAFALLWDVVELNAECRHLKDRCLMGDFIRSLFLPLRESSFEIAAEGIKVMITGKDDVSCIFSSKEPCIGIYLKDLCLVDLMVLAREVNFAFSPGLLPMFAAFDISIPVEPKHCRNGRQLWKRTRNKVYNTILPRRYLLYQVIDLALLSLRLVKAYQHFLVLVGCSMDKPSERMVIGISNGRNLSQSAIEEWKLISEIERELHAEAIAWARRVARSRVISEVQVAEDSIIACSVSPLLFFHKLFYLLWVAWRTICRIFGTVINILFQKYSSNTTSKIQLLQESSTHLFCFTLNLGKISVAVCPANAVKSASYEANQGNRISYSDLLSFCLIFQELLFVCEDKICEQDVSFSLGKIEVTSASISSCSHSAASFRKNFGSLEESWKGAADRKTIVWAEPAKLFLHSGESEAVSDFYSESAAVLVLKKLLGEMPLMWEQLCTRFQESNMLCSRDPFFLCDIKNFWLYPGRRSPDLGLWKCSLAVGKLYFTFGYSEILSIVVLMRQILWNFSESARSGDTVVSHSSWTSQDLQEIQYQARSKSDIKDMKMAMWRLLPGKPIELGAVIAGPHVHLSLKKEEYLGNATMADEDGFDLKIDVHGINLAVWPATDYGHPRLNDADAENFKLDEPRIYAISRSDNISFVSQGNYSLGYSLSFDGLHADFVGSKEHQQMQILVLKPVTVKLSSLRDYLHSFGKTAVASSAVLCASVEGGGVFFYVEQLSMFFQVFEGLISRAKIYAFGSSDFNDDKGRLASMKHKTVRAKSKIRMISVQDSDSSPLNSVAASYMITCTLEIDPFNVIVHGSTKSYSDSSPILSGAPSDKNLDLSKFPATGIWLSTYKMFGEVSCLEHKIELNADFSGFQAAIIRFKSQVWDMVGHLEDESSFLQFIDCLYEVSLSSSSFALLLCCLEETPLSETTRAAEEGSGSCSSPLATTNWLHVNVTLNLIFVGRSSIKNLFSGAHESNTVLSFSVGKDFQTFCLELQDGLICIDPTVLATFASCLNSYLQYFRNLSFLESHGKQKRAEPSEVMPTSDSHLIEGTAENISTSYNLFSWKDGEDLTVNLSQFSIVLLSANESDEVQKIMGMVDLWINLKPKNKRRFSFSIYQLNIHSQILKENMESTAKKIQIPSFSSAPSSSATSQLENDDSAEGSQHKERKNNLSTDASFSTSVSGDKIENDSVCPVVQEIYDNYILKGLSAYVSAEKLEMRDENDCFDISQGWVGDGSILGFDITISLSEIKMLMDCIESLSEVFRKETSASMKQRILPSATIQSEKNAEASVPDGAIVAIQDVYQHMYITVEHEENKFCLGSTTHYSLVGEKALFTVRSQKQRKWNFQASWFSLVSLHAKNDKGEPLQLNCCSGSGFVDISISNDSHGALWKVVSCKSEIDEGDAAVEPYNRLLKNTFHLVNKRNGCGVALVDGVLEFVKRPGNPFKFKIFNTSSSACDLARLSKLPVGMNGSDLGVLSKQALAIPCITFKVFNFTLTIVDQLSDHDDKFPLVKGCLNSIKVAIQILPHKARVMSKLIAILYYFDAHKVQWRELVHPFQTYIFYRRRFCSWESLTSFHGVPGLLCLGMERMDVSLTELPLDILLYVIGKLDLAGPFAVKSSTILANCCKLENQSGVNLLCQFYDSQEVRVGSKQSSLFPLRHIVNQPLASYVSIKLETCGTFSTSSMQLPLSQSQTCAWRTRIVSLKDARTYPGPFVVFDISKNVEEGLSVVVSPLLQIHNATKFSMELSFERPQQTEDESASLFLKSGDVIDDCLAAFEAVNLSGGVKKAFMSLSVGNFLFSFRPDIRGNWSYSNTHNSVGWSDSIEGGKPVRLSGIIDKIGYRVRKALDTQSSKCSFSIASCSVMSGDSISANIHFLVQSIIRDVPVVKPNNDAESRSSTVAFLQRKEIFLLPTVRVYNLLQLDVHVLLTESDISKESENIGNQATIPCGSAVELYANPALLCFTVTLVAFSSSCKPVKSGDWIKRLNKKKDGVQFLHIDLDFCVGKYFASLRLTRDDRGILEAVIYTSYTLRNDTDFPLFCFMPNQKPLSRDEIQRLGSVTPPHLGSFLPPRSLRSWFMKSNKLRMTLLDEESSKVLDLDSLSGLTEVSLPRTRLRLRHLLKLGVSLGPLRSTTLAPSEVVSMAPRYVVSNNSNEKIFVRQCGYEDDLEGITGINSRQKAVLLLVDGASERRNIGIFEKLLWKHRASNDDSSLLVQFRLDSTGFGWSGPVCVASLGRFFLKFKRSSENPVHQSNISKQIENSSWDFAAVNVVEEGSSLVLHFSRPPASDLPYRIENHLPVASVTYYQKDKFEPEILPPSCSVSYALDDLTCPHKLVVRVNDPLSLGYEISREISLNKLRPWKPLSRRWQQRELAYQFPSNRTGDEKQFNRRWLDGMDIGKIGYEIYADGTTRVLRLCGPQDSTRKGFTLTQSHMRIQLRFSSLAVQLLEQKKQDFLEEEDPSDLAVYSPIIVGRLENISLDSVFSDKQKYHQVRVQSINVDEKWPGAPFASLLRRHQLSSSSSEGNVLFIVFVLNPGPGNVKQVKYLSIRLQPVDLNLDEETLLKIVPFWRKSLSQSTQSQQYYFDRFEIHPIKIIASFLPEESYSSYNSAQEALRTLLHSVIKIPTVKNAVVELNGLLVTHALVTTRELLIRCAQHYSWYSMRAIYIAKGSLLLPPSFASMFDDLASSSLDVFFDPSSSLHNVRGLTLGTFKLMSKYIKGKGLSGTKRYFGDLGETLRAAGSNVLFTAVTEISDSVLKGAESSGFNGMVIGFHHGILKLAMEPSLLGTALLEGGPDRKIELNQSPGVDELYIEGYLQAMLDAIYKQEYLRVRVIDKQVVLKNLPPNTTLIEEIMDRVKDFLVSKGLLKGNSSTISRPLRHLRGDKEWKIGPTVITLCEHLFVSFTIRMMRKQTGHVLGKIKPEKPVADSKDVTKEGKGNILWRGGIGKFVFSAILAYVDGRLCRNIPHPIARRIVSGFMLSFLDKRDD